MSVVLSVRTRSYPTHPYTEIADKILGRSYEVSLVFIGETRARALNRSTRGKSYAPNVLSFSLSPTQGEIYICPLVAKREAKAHGFSVNGYIAYLFIHGLLHLKGYDHGATMEKLEARYVQQFSIR